MKNEFPIHGSIASASPAALISLCDCEILAFESTGSARQRAGDAAHQ